MKHRRFAVLGLGELGSALARELTRLGCEVLAVDRNRRQVDAIRDEVAVAAVADISDKHALAEIITSEFDVAIIAIGTSLEASIMATLALKELKVGEVWAETNSPERGLVLQRIGVDRVISPEREVGRRLAHELANPNLLEFVPLSEGYGVLQAEAPHWTHGKTLVALDLRNRMRLAVISIKRAKGGRTLVPAGATVIEPGDVLTLVGVDADLARFREQK